MSSPSEGWRSTQGLLCVLWASLGHPLWKLGAATSPSQKSVLSLSQYTTIKPQKKYPHGRYSNAVATRTPRTSPANRSPAGLGSGSATRIRGAWPRRDRTRLCRGPRRRRNERRPATGAQGHRHRDGYRRGGAGPTGHRAGAEGREKGKPRRADPRGEPRAATRDKWGGAAREAQGQRRRKKRNGTRPIERGAERREGKRGKKRGRGRENTPKDIVT